MNMTDKNQPLPVDIDVHGVKQLLDGEEEFLLLDCREPSEYETCKLEGSVLIPMKTIAKNLDQLEAYKERPIVVY